MIYQEFQPREELRDYVECIWILQSRRSLTGAYSLPDGKPLLLFNLGHPYCRRPVHHPESAGQWVDRFQLIHQGMETVRIDHRGPIDLMGIRFHSDGLFPLTGIPMARFIGKALPARTLLGSMADEWGNQVAGKNIIKDRVEFIEQSLLSLAARARGTDPVVRASIQAMIQGRGELRVAELRGQIGISKSCLEKKYQTIIGLSAKNLGNIIRFNCIINDWKQGKSLTELAHAHGFFDQAHFNRNFRAFTGISPRKFFQLTNQLVVGGGWSVVGGGGNRLPLTTDH